jgi:hypothetical protein
MSLASATLVGFAIGVSCAIRVQSLRSWRAMINRWISEVPS